MANAATALDCGNNGSPRGVRAFFFVRKQSSDPTTTLTRARMLPRRASSGKQVEEDDRGRGPLLEMQLHAICHERSASSSVARCGLCATTPDFSACAQRIDVLENLDRELVVVHRGTALAVRTKRARTGRFEVRAVQIAGFEVDDVVIDQREERAIRIQTDASEHALPVDRGHAAELLENELAKVVRDRHAGSVAGRRVCGAVTPESDKL